MEQTKGQSLIEEIKHPPDEQTTDATTTVHSKEGHLPATTIRSRVHSPRLSPPPPPSPSRPLCLSRLRLEEQSLMSTAFIKHCFRWFSWLWCISLSPSHFPLLLSIALEKCCQQAPHSLLTSNGVSSRHCDHHYQSLLPDQLSQHPVSRCRRAAEDRVREAGECKRRKRRRKETVREAGNLQLLISAAVASQQILIFIGMLLLLLLICGTTSPMMENPPPSATSLAKSFFIVQFPSSGQLATSTAAASSATHLQQKWPVEWSVEQFLEEEEESSRAASIYFVDSQSSSLCPKLLRLLLSHVICHPCWTLTGSLLLLLLLPVSFALYRRLMSSAACLKSVHQKLHREEGQTQESEAHHQGQQYQRRTKANGRKRQHHFHHPSLISRYGVCLLVSCLCLLLPQPSTSLQLNSGSLPVASALTGTTLSASFFPAAVASSKMQTSAKVKKLGAEVPKPLALLSGAAGSDNVTATQICPLFLAPESVHSNGDSSSENVAQSFGVGRVIINSTAALSSNSSSEAPQGDGKTDQSSGSSSGSAAGVRNPCLCYGAESGAGIFVECTSASMGQIRATLGHLRPHRSSVRSLSLYRLNDSRTLPENLFEAFSSISELHISSNFSAIGNDLTFAGLEESLTSLSFVNSQISTIPKSALSKLRQLQSLDIQANRIATLDAYAFYGLPLRTLNLQNNIIESLHEFAFGGLENTLEELSLIGNRLANFPLFALRRLRKLLSLKLQSNLISQIPDDGFTRFTLLETLDLQSNAIRHLSSRSFITMPKLKTLYASNNLLTVVSDSSIFAQLHYLETLDLSLNRLRVVNLDGLESVRNLDLSYNHLHDLRLQGMLGLRELFASHNNILQLVNETFLNCSSLEVLYLQHNSIHSILYNAFHRLNQLRVLDLSYNQLRQLHSALFKYTSQLESLNLDHNLISDAGLESGIFQELVSCLHFFHNFHQY